MKSAGMTLFLVTLIYTGLTGRIEAGGFPSGAQDASTKQESSSQFDPNPTLKDIDVLNKHNAGETDAEIIHEIETNPTSFDVSQPSVVFLRKRGVSQAVVNAMVKAAGGKPAPIATVATPPSADPPPAEPAKTAPAPAAKPVPAKTDLHKIRKVVLEMDWAEDAATRPRAVASLEKRTCLKIVDSIDAADAKVRWTTEGLMGVAIQVTSKDDVALWSRRGMTPPLKALRLALGCE